MLLDCSGHSFHVYNETEISPLFFNYDHLFENLKMKMWENSEVKYNDLKRKNFLS